MQRRTFIQLGVLSLGFHIAGAGAKTRPGLASTSLRDAIAAIQRSCGGRLGVAFLDTGSGGRFEFRAGERFPMCSTFKWLLVAAALRDVDHGRQDISTVLPISASDLVTYSPVTELLVGKGASIARLCEAAVSTSDNTAANLLLQLVGGPAGFTRFARSIGDRHTRLDRIETSLNSALPGDPRDTTTPRAMVDDMQRVLLGNVLSPASRGMLTAWLVGNQTGDARLRAGIPAGWRVGDKTGSGANGTNNDVAIIWPPQRAPLLVASYLTGSKLDSNGRESVHRRVAEAMVGREIALPS